MLPGLLAVLVVEFHLRFCDVLCWREEYVVVVGEGGGDAFLLAVEAREGALETFVLVAGDVVVDGTDLG